MSKQRGSGDGSSSIGSRFFVAFCAIVFWGAVSFKFDKKLRLSSYIDYFEASKNMIPLSGNFSMEMPSVEDGKVVAAQSSKSESPLVWSTDLYDAIREKRIRLSPSASILVGKETGHLISMGGSDRLVVNVNESYLFWNNGQDFLCQLLRNMTLSMSIDGMQDVPPALLNATMDCVDHAANKQGLGQGNWVTAIYDARMAAVLAGVDFQFQCSDGRQSKMKLLLPWFDQYIPAPSSRKEWPFGGERPNEEDACTSKYPRMRIDKMALQIQNDIRRMAVELLGKQDDVRQHPLLPSDAAPLIPDVHLDDVAIHFRCGDVLGGAKRSDFGVIRFWEYKRWIPVDAKSIGILTQPFEKERNRGTDARKADNCRRVVETLVDYLQAFAPKAKISIHNGANETLPLAYARLAMANYSFTSLSSFGIFPIVGTFGQGHFQKGNRGCNPFATHIPKYLSNVHEMRAEVRTTWDMFGKPIEDIISWFVDESSAPKEVLELVNPTEGKFPDTPRALAELNHGENLEHILASTNKSISSR
jgi:hypothetical protein